MKHSDVHAEYPQHEATMPPLSLCAEATPVDANEFAVAFGEALHHTLDLDTWQPGENLAALYERLEAEIDRALRQED